MTQRFVVRIEEFLRQRGVVSGPCEIKPLKGGYANSLLRVDAGDRRLVVKTFGKPMSGTLFPNLPAEEAAALQRLSGLDVAPELVGFWPEHDLLAYSYVEGEVWNGDIVAVAQLFRRKEVADPKGFRGVPVTPEEILAEGDRLLARCNEIRLPTRPTSIELPPPYRLSLIHTDVGPANLIGSGDGLRLIDWQCPAMGDLCEDIYGFLSGAFHILSERPPLTDAAVAAFFAALNRPDLEDRYRALRPFFAWRMAAYCCLRSETHPEADIRARYREAAQVELAPIAG
jgi:thiamine kinase